MSALSRRDSQAPSDGRKTSARGGFPHLFGKRVLGWYAVSICGAILLGGIELAIALFLQLFLQSLGILDVQATTSKYLRLLPATPSFVAIALCTIAAVRAVGQYLVSQSAVHASESLNARMRRLAAWEMLLHPRGRNLDASEVNARLVDTFPRAAAGGFWLAALASAVVQATIVTLVMTLAAWKESLIGFVGLGCVGLLVLSITSRIRAVVRDVPAEQRALTAAIQRVARNAFLVRVLRTEQREHGVFMRSIRAVENRAIRAGALGNLAAALPPFLGTLLLTALIIFSQRVLHSPSVTLLSFLYLFVRLVQNLSAAVTAFSGVNQYRPQLHEARLLFGTYTEAEIDAAQATSLPALPVASRSRVRPAKPAAIEVEGVAFAYAPGGVPILEDVTFTIPAGSQFGIVGPSGCGKSTLLSIVLGVLSPTKGRVRIDGLSPEAYLAQPDVRVGYVGADPYLIAGTVRDNLLYGCPREVTEDDLRQALAAAQLLSTVDRFAEGLEHAIAENGSGLSAGQQQRLCLARALLAEPDLLILDEASANLDVATESEIAASLRSLRGKATVIMVSHRPGLIQYADDRMALGRLSES